MGAGRGAQPSLAKGNGACGGRTCRQFLFARGSAGGGSRVSPDSHRGEFLCNPEFIFQRLPVFFFFFFFELLLDNPTQGKSQPSPRFCVHKNTKSNSTSLERLESLPVRQIKMIGFPFGTCREEF